MNPALEAAPVETRTLDLPGRQKLTVERHPGESTLRILSPEGEAYGRPVGVALDRDDPTARAALRPEWVDQAQEVVGK